MGAVRTAGAPVVTSHRARIDPVPSDHARPTWSVMIPTFNCADLLDRTLASVLAQDPGPSVMQIEVVDDASHDEPEAVVRAVAGDRVRFFRQPENVGHIRNFATCIRRATGHYVHLLHGDDLVLPGFYDAVERGFESHASVGAAFTRWMLIDAEDEQLSVADPLQPAAGPLIDALARLACEQHIVTPSIAVRRSVFERLGGFDDRLRCAEDWEMWVRIAAEHDVWYDPRTLAAYRTHPNSNTGRHHRSAEELRYTALAIDIFRAHLPPERSKEIVRAARLAYARTALRNAQAFSASGDRQAAGAHLRMALRLSPSPKLLVESVRALHRAGRSRGAA